MVSPTANPTRSKRSKDSQAEFSFDGAAAAARQVVPAEPFMPASKTSSKKATPPARKSKERGVSDPNPSKKKIDKTLDDLDESLS